MIGCLPTQAIAFEWKPDFSDVCFAFSLRPIIPLTNEPDLDRLCRYIPTNQSLLTQFYASRTSEIIAYLSDTSDSSTYVDAVMRGVSRARPSDNDHCSKRCFPSCARPDWNIAWQNNIVHLCWAHYELRRFLYLEWLDRYRQVRGPWERDLIGQWPDADNKK